MASGAIVAVHPLLTACDRKRLPLLAILSPADPAAAVMKLVNQPFKEALAKLGWEPGKSLRLEERYAHGDASRLPALAAELVGLTPDVLFTNTSTAVAAAAAATHTIPIVAGPAGSVLIDLAGGDLAKPTTNVTGFVLSRPETDVKCISLLIEILPALRRIGVLVNPNNPQTRDYPRAQADVLAKPHVSLTRLEASGVGDIDRALEAANLQRVEALFVVDDAQIAADPEVRKRILRFAELHRVPVISTHERFARDGALMTMGPTVPVLAVAAAGYVDKLLRGAKVADLPVQLPTVLTTIINLKAAAGLGVAVPPAIVVHANEVIE